MKFKDMPYQRPDMDTLLARYAQLAADAEQADAQGLLEHVTVVAGQEMGPKKDCIAKAMAGRYQPNHVLMVGDAPGDLAAAQANGVLFYPIIPGQELESWVRLRSEAAEHFHTQQYKGPYMDNILEEFDQTLLDNPQW